MKNSLTTLNPSTGEIIKTYLHATADETESKLKLAEEAFQKWKKTSLEERAGLLLRLEEVLSAKKHELARLITQEMGKIPSESVSEIEKCAKEAAYYAKHGPQMFADERAPVDELEAYVSFLPLGTILAVMPWNFPFWQVTRFSIPTLLAGNTVLLKHASNVTGCSLALEEMFLEAGFPVGVFQSIVTPSSEVERLIEDSRIQGVTLTGSVGAGRKIAGQAGSAIKKSVMELGGSDAFIVLKDADLDLAVQAAISARFGNNGQVCIAAKRFIIEDAVADTFQEKFADAIRNLGTKLAPMAKKELRDELHAQVEKSINQGAKLIVGGKPKDGPGFFYEPTLLVNVTTQTTAAVEETFGPVAVLMRARDAAHAIELTNQSIYGLSSNLWTRDLNLAKKLARQIEAGSVFINSYSKSDPRVPIGGIKASGYGRELSHFGPKEFVNIQTVWVGS